MAVRRSLRFRLSAADVRDLLAERGVAVSARTVRHRVRRFAPLLARSGPTGGGAPRHPLVPRRDLRARGRAAGLPLPVAR